MTVSRALTAQSDYAFHLNQNLTLNRERKQWHPENDKKTKEFYIPFFLVLSFSTLANHLPWTDITEGKGKGRGTTVLSFSSSLLIFKVKVENWKNLKISRRLKTVGLVVYSISNVLVRTKCICMFEPQNKNCVVSVISHLS